MNHLPRIGARTLSAAAVAVVAAEAPLYDRKGLAGRAAEPSDDAPASAASPLDFVPADAVAVLPSRLLSDLVEAPGRKGGSGESRGRSSGIHER